MLRLVTTPMLSRSSSKTLFSLLILLGIALGGAWYGQRETQARPTASGESTQVPAITPLKVISPAESSLGVADTGVFGDLAPRLQIELPPDLEPAQARGVFDPQRNLLVLYQAGWPVKVYPTGDGKALQLGSIRIRLRAGDHQELRGLLADGDLEVLRKGESAAPADRDDDGIPDALDVLIGAHKTVLNGANYGGGYRRIPYPNGDIPREDGVCTDVVVRAVRNAGLDLQSELQRDIKRKSRAYPMVKKRNPHIDHRRVKTLLPYFRRRWDRHTVRLDDEADPLRPGDVVFMDTFPKRRGPDHIGLLSHRRGASGHLLVINNWTNGFQTSEMDLLDYVPLTHRFRLRTGD